MPKVTEKYLEEKRRMIVDCAYQVCLRKPVEMVTISDVIAETGMSQGAIYRYYAGLDEILTDIATKMRSEYNIIDSFNEILSDKKVSIEELTYRVCDCLAEAMEKHLMDIQKINFDLGVLTINEPERAAKIMANIKGTGNLESLGKHLKRSVFSFPPHTPASRNSASCRHATAQARRTLRQSPKSFSERLHNR